MNQLQFTYLMMKKLNLSRKQLNILITVVVFGLMLRLLPDFHRTIWSYDQARDSFVMREMIRNFDIKLIGPQTEHYGLFHGPLYYYLLSPFYYLSGGEVGLPIMAMTLIVFSSVIPIYLLVIKLSKSKYAAILSVFIFAISYQFIEYSRWLSNISISLPFIAWAYYLFYEILKSQTIPDRVWNDSSNKSLKQYFLLGLVTGLAVQGELFLLSLAAVIFVVLIFSKSKILNLAGYASGGIIGVFPLLISEFKFKFRGVSILFDQVLFSGATDSESLMPAILGYFEHLGVTSMQVIAGVNYFVGGIILALIIFLTIKFSITLKPKESKAFQIWLLSILFSHAILFKFSYINSVFLDMGLAVLLVIITSLAIHYSFKINKLVAVLILVSIVILQATNYSKFMINARPLDHFGFIQEPSTLMHKEQILDAIYDYADGKDFTISVIGTPFGVRTVWASVFELYTNKTKLNPPKWYGYFAEGYPGDNYFQKVEEPGDLHVLILESNLRRLLADKIVEEHMGNQNTHTVVDKELEIYDTRIQFRSRI